MNARMIVGMLLLLGILGPYALPAQESGGEVVHPTDVGVVSSICGTSFGTRFNLEPRPNAQAQFGQAIDVLPNRVASGVDLVVGGSANSFAVMGYHVSRDADCAAEFEGLLGLTRGGPLVAADPARDAVFMVGVPTPTEVSVFRSAAGTLLSPTACPNGTHTAAQAASCWPTNLVLTARIDFEDQAHLAIDERASGTGAGDIYIAYNERDITTETRSIKLVACTNDLASCSAPLVMSGGDTAAHFAHVGVRPDGQITLTWINRTAQAPDPPTFQIKYRTCTPAVPPTAPTCGAISLVHTETQPLSGFLAAHDFDIATRPKHDHRVDANGTETYVVWDRCKVPSGLGAMPGDICPDADVVMKASKNNGATWSALTCVSCGANDQFFPAVRTDRSRNIVNIALYSSATDTTFQHRVRVLLYHLNPGGATPDAVEPHVITTLMNDPSGNPDPTRLGGRPSFGDYIGVAARGTGIDGQSRAYVHYTYNTIQGVYNGVQVPELNNHLSRLDY